MDYVQLLANFSKNPFCHTPNIPSFFCNILTNYILYFLTQILIFRFLHFLTAFRPKCDFSSN